MVAPTLHIEKDVPLAPYTTLGIGGCASEFVEVTTEGELSHALHYARARTLPVFILGGGSNVVVSDRGVAGLTIKIALCGVYIADAGERFLVTAAAGEVWDDLVARMIEGGFAGVECLSGIPGLVGATPIQNVGAYGQEVSDTIVSVRTIDAQTLAVRTRAAEECQFAYRHSLFKTDAGRREVVLSVTYALDRDKKPKIRNGELAKTLGKGDPTLIDVRAAVLSLRRSKSMVLDPTDANCKSVGSFFTNPIVDRELADRVAARAVELKCAMSTSEMPRYDADGGRTKLSAAWLIERAGFTKGLREGALGISSRHSLAIVNHGGGTSRELQDFAQRIVERVRQRFGVELVAEPTFVGF